MESGRKEGTRQREKGWNQDISLIKVQFYYSETWGYEEGEGAHSRQIILGVQFQVTTCLAPEQQWEWQTNRVVGSTPDALLAVKPNQPEFRWGGVTHIH